MIKIYSQGDLNGACFQYAIANAYKALSKKEITKSAWSKAVNGVFFLEDFMDGQLGTERYNDNPLLFGTVVNHMLGEFSGKVQYEVKHQKISNIASIKNLISEKSIAIFCYSVENEKGKELINHWTCGVGLNEDSTGIQVACSSCADKPQKNEQLNRWYNEIRNSKNITKVIKESVFQISIKS